LLELGSLCETKMNFTDLEAAIEAILFSMGEAVPTKKIAEALELEEEDIYNILINMKDKYDEKARGVRIIEIDNAFQMCTKEAYYDYVKKVNYKLKEFVLTDVLIETLAIVAYKQPITRAHIESIRGVNSNHAVNRLVEYNLVYEVGRVDAPGKPILFGTTKDFLRGFGLQNVEELPQLGEEAMNHLKEEAEKEVQLTIGDDGHIEEEQDVEALDMDNLVLTFDEED